MNTNYSGIFSKSLNAIDTKQSGQLVSNPLEKFPTKGDVIRGTFVAKKLKPLAKTLQGTSSSDHEQWLYPDKIPDPAFGVHSTSSTSEMTRAYRRITSSSVFSLPTKTDVPLQNLHPPNKYKPKQYVLVEEGKLQELIKLDKALQREQSLLGEQCLQVMHDYQLSAHIPLPATRYALYNLCEQQLQRIKLEVTQLQLDWNKFAKENHYNKPFLYLKNSYLHNAPYSQRALKLRLIQEANETHLLRKERDTMLYEDDLSFYNNTYFDVLYRQRDYERYFILANRYGPMSEEDYYKDSFPGKRYFLRVTIAARKFQFVWDRYFAMVKLRRYKNAKIIQKYVRRWLIYKNLHPIIRLRLKIGKRTYYFFCWHHWKDYVHRVKGIKTRIARHEQSKEALCFNAWKKLIFETQHNAKKMIRRLLNSSMYRVLAAWKEYVEEQKALKKRLRRLFQNPHFDLWVQYTKFSKYSKMLHRKMTKIQATVRMFLHKKVARHRSAARQKVFEFGMMFLSVLSVNRVRRKKLLHYFEQWKPKEIKKRNYKLQDNEKQRLVKRQYFLMEKEKKFINDLKQFLSTRNGILQLQYIATHYNSSPLNSSNSRGLISQDSQSVPLLSNIPLSLLWNPNAVKDIPTLSDPVPFDTIPPPPESNPVYHEYFSFHDENGIKHTRLPPIKETFEEESVSGKNNAADPNNSDKNGTTEQTSTNNDNAKLKINTISTPIKQKGENVDNNSNKHLMPLYNSYNTSLIQSILQSAIYFIVSSTFQYYQVHQSVISFDRNIFQMEYFNPSESNALPLQTTPFWSRLFQGRKVIQEQHKLYDACGKLLKKETVKLIHLIESHHYDNKYPATIRCYHPYCQATFVNEDLYHQHVMMLHNTTSNTNEENKDNNEAFEAENNMIRNIDEVVSVENQAEEGEAVSSTSTKAAAVVKFSVAPPPIQKQKSTKFTNKLVASQMMAYCHDVECQTYGPLQEEIGKRLKQLKLPAIGTSGMSNVGSSPSNNHSKFGRGNHAIQQGGLINGLASPQGSVFSSSHGSIGNNASTRQHRNIVSLPLPQSFHESSTTTTPRRFENISTLLSLSYFHMMLKNIHGLELFRKYMLNTYGLSSVLMNCLDAFLLIEDWKKTQSNVFQNAQYYQKAMVIYDLHVAPLATRSCLFATKPPAVHNNNTLPLSHTKEHEKQLKKLWKGYQLQMKEIMFTIHKQFHYFKEYEIVSCNSFLHHVTKYQHNLNKPQSTWEKIKSTFSGGKQQQQQKRQGGDGERGRSGSRGRSGGNSDIDNWLPSPSRGSSSRSRNGKKTITGGLFEILSEIHGGFHSHSEDEDDYDQAVDIFDFPSIENEELLDENGNIIIPTDSMDVTYWTYEHILLPTIFDEFEYYCFLTLYSFVYTTEYVFTNEFIQYYDNTLYEQYMKNNQLFHDYQIQRLQSLQIWCIDFVAYEKLVQSLADQAIEQITTQEIEMLYNTTEKESVQDRMLHLSYIEQTAHEQEKLMIDEVVSWCEENVLEAIYELYVRDLLLAMWKQQDYRRGMMQYAGYIKISIKQKHLTQLEKQIFASQKVNNTSLIKAEDQQWLDQTFAQILAKEQQILQKEYMDHYRKLEAELLNAVKQSTNKVGDGKGLTKEQAAIRIQKFVRGRQSRKRTRKIFAKTYQKLYDSSSQSYYYYNNRTEESSWTPPRIFRYLYPKGKW